jgi:diguanylate cyclase (GGDEF)-like protein
MAEAGYALLGLLALSYSGFLFAIIATTARLSVERSGALRALTKIADQLKERDEIISVQSLRFETALNNMTQGLGFFDGQERLIVCNKRYIEMYGLDPRRVHPGISLSEIIDMRYDSGARPKMSKQEYVAWRRKVSAADRPSETIHELTDGRVYAVYYQPMANGAWVATTDDITERQRLSDELAANHKLLADRTALLQAIIDDFPGGIGYYDKDLRVALCNDKAKAMLDLPERLFANGPPRLEELLRFNAGRGEYGPGEVRQLVADKLALITGRKSYRSERVRPGGTVLDVTGTPVVGGGYITTYMDITERYRAEAKIAHLATHDALTDLPNRVLFLERLDKAVRAVRTGEGRVALLMLDLNKFKEVNDTLGHPAGDSLLKAVAERLASCVRGDDLVARLGGDEFAIVVHSFDAAVDAALIAARVQSALSVRFELGQHRVEIGVSIGVSVSSAGGTDAEQLIQQADAALYRAKAVDGGPQQFFGAEMGQHDLPRPVAPVRRAAGAAR